MVICAQQSLKGMFKNEGQCNKDIEVHVRVSVQTHTVEDQLLTVTAILEQLMFAIGTF